MRRIDERRGMRVVVVVVVAAFAGVAASLAVAVVVAYEEEEQHAVGALSPVVAMDEEPKHDVQTLTTMDADTLEEEHHASMAMDEAVVVVDTEQDILPAVAAEVVVQEVAWYCVVEQTPYDLPVAPICLLFVPSEVELEHVPHCREERVPLEKAWRENAAADSDEDEVVVVVAAVVVEAVHHQDDHMHPVD